MKSSRYRFLMKGGKWNIELQYSKNKKTSQFDIESIDELKGRALLIQHTTGNAPRGQNVPTEEEERKTKEEQEIIGRYIQFANHILSVINNLDLLDQYGYPEDEQDFQRKFVCGGQGDLEDLEIFERDIEGRLAGWKEDLICQYKNSYWLLSLMEGTSGWSKSIYWVLKPTRTRNRGQRTFLSSWGKTMHGSNNRICRALTESLHPLSA